jgi:hypothetical protein
MEEKTFIYVYHYAETPECQKIFNMLSQKYE